MLPTFVIGLREGLEAALIVGIIAAFLRKQGRRDLLRWVFLGVFVAIVICAGIGVALNVLVDDLPQRQQEGLETVIGALAVGMVTYMVVWMKRNSRGLKGQLEGLAADALATDVLGGASSAGRAMVLMAFLAVLREGIETVVFLLAVFQYSRTGTAPAAAGAVLGIAVAVALGYGIYRGGVRINLSRFFRATGLVLALVAAGIVVNALHSAHEAGWIDWGQSQVLDLRSIVAPNSVQASLLTGMLGVQPQPVLLELVGWLVYLIPVGVFVAWPPGRSVARRTAAVLLGAVGAVAAVAAAVLVIARPGAPATAPATDGVRVIAASGSTATVSTPTGQYRLGQETGLTRAGAQVDQYTATGSAPVTGDHPATLPLSEVAALNGGNLPIGLNSTGVTSVGARYAASVTRTLVVEPRTRRVLSFTSVEVVTAQVTGSGGGALSLARAVSTTSTGTSADAMRAATHAALDAVDDLDRRDTMTSLAWLLGVLGAAALLASAGLAFRGRRADAETVVIPEPELVRH